MNKVLRRCATILILSMLFASLYLPLLLIAQGSVNQARYSNTWHGWTWHWYQSMLADPDFLHATAHSLQIAVSAASISTLCSVVMAFVLNYYHSFGHRTAYRMWLYMMLAPDLVLALGLLMAYHLLHWPLGFLSLLFGHIALCLPLATLLTLQQCQNISPTLFMAAKDLGATDFQVFRSIVLPMLRSTLMLSFLLCFVISFDDTVLSYFLTGPEFQTLPVYLYGQIKLGVTPTIHAISTSMLMLSVIVLSMAYPALRTQHEN